MTAYIIGNGESRRNIDLKLLNGMTYGCNALHREFTPDVLVATDDPISTAIQRSGYAKHYRFHTRKVYSGTGAKPLRPQYAKWSSGPNAVQLAVYDKHKDIVLLGFDFGSTHRNYNNMYAGTEFYSHGDDIAYCHTNWTHQIHTIMQMAGRTEFTIVVGPETCNMVEKFTSLANVKIISIAEFINNVMETNT